MPYFGAWPEALARLMKERGVDSRAELARKAKLSPSTVSDYFNRKQEPGVGRLERMLEAVGADFADLHRALLAVEQREPEASLAAVAEPPASYDPRPTLPPEVVAEVAANLRRAAELLDFPRRTPDD